MRKKKMGYERFLLSLSTCKACDVMDDALNLLPLSSHIRSITQVPTNEKDPGVLSEAKRDVRSLKDALNVRGGKRGTKMAISLAFLLLSFCGLAACEPLLTIQSPDGDTIECISAMDQPSLQNPLLKNHIFQDYPSDMTKTEEDGFGWQVWHGNGTACPHGSVPIRLVEGGLSQKYSPLISDAGDRATQGHKYAIAYVTGNPLYGAKATLDVWQPIVESGDDFSLAQIWVKSGEYKTNDLNTVEAGWQVYPNRYGDHQPRLFTYWTRDAYLTSGCYNDGRRCKNDNSNGFVHVNRHVAQGGAINQTSTFGGDRFAISLQIWKDPVSGHWWLGMGQNVVPIGYWPVELFTTLSHHALEVQWGGEVLYLNTTGLSNRTQMGSGVFPGKGFEKAASFCNLQVAQDNRSFLPVQDFKIDVTEPDHYTIEKAHGRGCGEHFYYGGPGPLPSSSLQRDPQLSFVFLVLALYFVV